MVIVQRDLAVLRKLGGTHEKGDDAALRVLGADGVDLNGGVIQVQGEVVVFQHAGLQDHLHGHGYGGVVQVVLVQAIVHQQRRNLRGRQGGDAGMMGRGSERAEGG